jgi:hypothetical protein
MGESLGLDWAEYLHSLSEDALGELAAWLAAQRLEAWEFLDIVDRAYVQAGEDRRGEALTFITRWGRPAVAGYARRKRHFAELTATIEEARQRGALPGDVAPDELQPLQPQPSLVRSPSKEDVLNALHRVQGGSI